MSNLKWLSCILYGLILIWTGLARGIAAQEYKPNALWFCAVLGLLSIAAGYLFRLKKCWPAIGLATLAAVVALAFYLNEFISEPAKEANVRVGVIILASVAQLAFTWLPPAKSEKN